MHLKNTSEYDVTDACPEPKVSGAKAEFDRQFEKWKVKQANKRPKFKWVKEEE